MAAIHGGVHMRLGVLPRGAGRIPVTARPGTQIPPHWVQTGRAGAMASRSGPNHTRRARRAGESPGLRVYLEFAGTWGGPELGRQDTLPRS